ncbi:hypothetical protein CIK05_04860 [Bdellovibrio sp. qaytius]|nr:hypothetical protein CIK05_04860 [Bdellovibrio sp. qaytius]
MKKLLGLFLVLSYAVTSEAQIKQAYQRAKQAVTGSAKFAQLHYFPKQWETDLQIGYRYENLGLILKSSTATIADTDQSISVIESSVSLGLLDSLFAQIEWDYEVSKVVSYNQPAGQASNKYLGAGEPTLSVNYRLVNADSFKLDTKLGYQPSFGDLQDADATHDGNNLLGGPTAVIGAKAVALITDNSQIALDVTYQNFGEATEIDQITKEKTTIDAHNQLVFQLSTLTELTNDLFFGLQLDVINIDAYDRHGLTTTEIGTTSGRVLNLIGKYEFTPDSLINADVGYVLDYKGKALNFDLVADGYSAAISYAVRF